MLHNGREWTTDFRSPMFLILYSDQFLDHQTGRTHPESPHRLSAIQTALLAAPWADQLAWQEPTAVAVRSPLSLIEQTHEPRYVNAVKLLSEKEREIDADTPVSARSYDVALLAVNAWIDGIDHVMQTGEPCFVLARPPGHHARPAWGMGFCLFGNAAIATKYALSKGVARVAILDWDVHHGNGTQEILELSPKIRFCSLHESPQYPGTGRATERGLHENVLNLPMQRGSTIADYLPLFEERVVPFLSEFEPDLLIVSAGYDANLADPLAGIALQPEDYGVFTQYCLSVTRKIVFGLEGGYDLDALSRSVVATIEACL